MIKEGGRTVGLMLVLIILLGHMSGAQSSTQQEVTIFLKNGKVIKGKTTLSMFEGHLTLEEDTFAQTHIPYADIQQIVFGLVPKSERAKVKVKNKQDEIPFTIKDKGYFGMIDAGFLVQNDMYYNDGPGVSISMVNGHAFTPHFRLGVGVGIDSYGYSNVTVAPLFISLSGLMNLRRFSPFYFLNAGSSLAWANGGEDFNTYHETKGGLMLHPGVGYRFNMGGTGVAFGLGYKIQRASLRYSRTDWNSGGLLEVDEVRTFYRLSMTVGVHF